MSGGEDGDSTTSRWERLTKTKGRAATFIGGWLLWLALGLIVSEDTLLGRPNGPYVALALLFVWLGALGVLEVRWHRQDDSP